MITITKIVKVCGGNMVGGVDIQNSDESINKTSEAVG